MLQLAGDCRQQLRRLASSEEDGDFSLMRKHIFETDLFQLDCFTQFLIKPPPETGSVNIPEIQEIQASNKLQDRRHVSR